MLRDAKVSRVFIHGSRHTYLACPLVDTKNSVMYDVSFTASVVGNLYRVIEATKAFPVLSMHKFGDLLTEKQLPQMKNKIYGGLNETEMTPFQGDQQDVPA